MNPPPAQSFAPRMLAGPALRLQPDGRLVKLVRDGSEAAFEEIVRRYGTALQRYAGAIVTGQRAEDVTQDAFSKAFVALKGSDKEIKLRPWLYRIVRNTALNELRDRPPQTAELDERQVGGEEPLDTIERREQVESLMAGLAALPEPQRAAIVMRELEGLSHEQIAKSLGVSGGAVRQSIHRARTALRNGAGMLVPLPLLRMLAMGVDSPGIAAGAGAGAGAGLGAKAAIAALLVAGTSVAGVAVQQNHDADAARPPSATHHNSSSTDASEVGSREAEPGDDRGHGGSEDHSGHGRDGGSSRDNSGPGSSSSGSGSGDSGSGSSGSGSSGSGSGSSGSGSSGSSDSSSSGSSGSGSSGSGSSGSGSSGSGSSGSSTSGSGSSGSGSGSGDLLDH